MHRPTMSNSVEPSIDEMRPGRNHPKWRMVKLVAKSVLKDSPARSRSSAAWVEEASPLWRLIRTCSYWLCLMPVIAALVAASVTYIRTHPQTPPLLTDPHSDGIYFEPVTLTTDDHIQLEGWLAPALDAHQILANGMKALRQRTPAIILAHGFAQSRAQVLPLIKPLHQHGWTVLAIGMRGNGSLTAAGQTFGINEAMDIKAGVELLRHLPLVDDRHIAIVGIGSGANAAVLVADKYPDLDALVLDSPADTGKEAVTNHLASSNPALRWLNPFYTLAFQLGYGLNERDLDLDQYGKVLTDRPTLLMRWTSDAESDLPPQRVQQIVDFLATSLPAPQAMPDTQPSASDDSLSPDDSQAQSDQDKK
jgi:Serine aminopeptidase, S33